MENENVNMILWREGILGYLINLLLNFESEKLQKELKLKEQWKRTKSYKKKSWPSTQEGTEMLLGLIDAKIVSRVLQMAKISNEQLFWCEEKMKKLAISDGKLQRDPSPILFPC